MRRTKKDAEKTRETLLISAVKVFNNKGFVNATLADIAKESGVTRGAIYHHFGNKDDFIDAIIQTNKNKMDQVVQKVIDSDNDIFSSIKEIFNTLFQKLESDELYRYGEELFLKMQLSGDVKNQSKLKEASDEGFTKLVDAFDQAKEKGFISKNSDTKRYATMIASAYLGIIVSWLLHPEIISLRKDGMSLLNLLIDSLSIENK